MKLTDKQNFVYGYLKGKNEFTSPGEVGAAIFGVYKTGSGHSSTGSPICKKLVELGLAERNAKGYYKAIFHN